MVCKLNECMHAVLARVCCQCRRASLSKESQAACVLGVCRVPRMFVIFVFSQESEFVCCDIEPITNSHYSVVR